MHMSAKNIWSHIFAFWSQIVCSGSREEKMPSAAVAAATNLSQGEPEKGTGLIKLEIG